MAGLAVEAVVEHLKGEPDMPPRDIFLDPRLVMRGTTGPDLDGAHEPAVLLQRPGRGAVPAAGVQPGDEQAGGGVPGCSSPDGKDRT
jgi:hypothetical protein